MYTSYSSWWYNHVPNVPYIKEQRQSCPDINLRWTFGVTFLSRDKKAVGRTQKTSKPFKFDLKVKGHILSGSWMSYDDTAIFKYGKPTSKQKKKKKLRAGHESAQTDGRTDGVIPV